MKFALPSLVLLSLLPSLALADEVNAEVKAAEARVTEAVVKPLTTFEENRSRFSRARLPPKERRVRVTQGTPSIDASGRAFFPFAIDAKWGAGWQANTVVGCAYVDGAVLVKRGDDHRPAESLLGKNVKPVAGACVESKDSLAAVVK
ncbi:MAG: hypothetical protein SFW67_28275 [Myxococcaceae bacterium]|nr:hypothetical protein [Myxococcaceae bacterium]